MSSSARYERLPSSPNTNTDPQTPIDEELSIGNTPPSNRLVAFAHDPRFDIPTPPAWQRAALVALLILLFWLVFHMRRTPAEDAALSALLD